MLQMSILCRQVFLRSSEEDGLALKHQRTTLDWRATSRDKKVSEDNTRFRDWSLLGLEGVDTIPSHFDRTMEALN